MRAIMIREARNGWVLSEGSGEGDLMGETVFGFDESVHHGAGSHDEELRRMLAHLLRRFQVTWVEPLLRSTAEKLPKPE